MNQPENNSDLSKMLEGMSSAASVVDQLKKQFEKLITPELVDSLDPVTRAKMNGYISEIDIKSQELHSIKPKMDKAMAGLTNMLKKSGL